MRKVLVTDLHRRLIAEVYQESLKTTVTKIKAKEIKEDNFVVGQAYKDIQKLLSNSLTRHKPDTFKTIIAFNDITGKIINEYCYDDLAFLDER